MSRLIRISFPAVLALAALVLVAAGCGGGSTKNVGGSLNQNRPNGGGGLNGVSLGNCLIDENWLVQPNTTYDDGQTDKGANYHIDFYKTAAAAKKGATGKKGAEPIGTIVVTYQADKSPYSIGAPVPKADRAANATILSCVKKVNAGQY